MNEIDKLKKELSDEDLEALYDFTPPPGKNILPPVNDDLTEEELAEVPFYNQFKCGVMVITGEPGSGKETFMHFMLWKLKTLFKGFKVMLDKKPRLAFGAYVPFTTEILMDEFKSLDEKYQTGKSDIEHDFAKFSNNKVKINAVVNKWRNQNDSLFHNCGMGLGEFRRYFYNRDPHHPINKAISPLFLRYRHHGLLVLGTTPHMEELDIKSCLHHVTHEVRCSQTNKEGLHAATIHSYRHYSNNSVLEVAQRPITLFIDGLEPRKRLGGKCIYDIFNSYETGESVPRVKIKA